MAKEIERKFLVDPEKWDWKGNQIEIVQAYLVIHPNKIVRVRVAGEKAFLTIKGNLHGITRDEFEYPIPLDDARELFKICDNLTVEKRRYVHEIFGKKWEVDVFRGVNEGLIIAEIELDSESELIKLPEWVMCEVSTEERYSNFNLAIKPFSTW